VGRGGERVHPGDSRRADKRGNSLSLTGEYVWGKGIADDIPGWSAASRRAAAESDHGDAGAGVHANVDPGLAVFTADGSAPLDPLADVHRRRAIHHSRSRRQDVGPANYARSVSDNAYSFGAPGKVRSGEDFADFNLFGDITPAVRLGAEYAWFDDHYAAREVKVPPVDAINHRFQFPASFCSEPAPSAGVEPAGGELTRLRSELRSGRGSFKIADDNDSSLAARAAA